MFIRLSDEEDLLKALSREVIDIDGLQYHAFHWHHNFNEDWEPSLVPIWVVLPGLPPNLYHESFFRNIISLFGWFLRRDNSIR